MAQNPQPDHITAEFWWFIEELERLESADTVFAGAWGRSKPGGHCDAWGLWNHKDKNGAFTWRNDYTLRLADDKVLGTPLEQFGAATDWTFLSAQRGDHTNIRKYGNRIRQAFLNRDPRLKGWREVLIQADVDATADGYDFVSWTERTPDITHDWHAHFTCLRKFLKTLRVFQAMISILRGETLAQWLARGDDEVPNAIWYPQNGVNYWLSRSGERVPIRTNPEMMKVISAYPGCQYPRANRDGFPDTELGAVGWSAYDVDLVFGPIKGSGSPSGPGGVSAEQVHAIAEEEAREAIAGSRLVPPAN